MLELESLNVNQRQAVDWNDGPMLVLAGPGAGKTRVLTTRVARLIQGTPDKRFRVLALTFTTKAAEEMRGRVAHLLGPNVRRARLTTFHGFAADVLRQHGSHFGLRPDFTILNQDADRHLVLRDAMEEASDASIPSGATARGVLPLPDDAEAESVFAGDSLLAGFLSAASACAATDARPLLDTLRDDLHDRAKYREFAKNVLAWRDSHRRTPNIDTDEETEERSTWGSLTREIRHQLGADPPLGQFLQQIDLRQKTPPPRPTDVQCLTIHLAKGKEFQHVYLTGLAEEQLPSYQAVQGGSSAMDEERRNCFVAITRVQSSLTLTHADSYFGWPKQPSRFLAEMGLSSGNT